MRNVKEDLVKNLFIALHEANLADSNYQPNDLPAKASSQNNVYGHIGQAIKALGYEAEYNYYVESGSIPTNFSMDEEMVLAVFDSEYFDNDIHTKIDYIISRNPGYDSDQLLEMYDSLV